MVADDRAQDLAATLARDPEPLPGWLRQPSPGFDRAQFFASRTVYYPGSGMDGHAVSVCARAHAAHAFVHVDYGISKRAIGRRIRKFRGPALRGLGGYRAELEEEVDPSRLRPDGWIHHAEWERLSTARYASVKPFGLHVVLRRDGDRDDTHGPERLAILFVGADGHETYDRLYCQDDGTPPPFLAVVQDHGFGGNHDRFGPRGLLEQVARACGVYPKWLLVGAYLDRFEPWSGYLDTGARPEPGGMQNIPRRLYLRGTSGAGTAR